MQAGDIRHGTPALKLSFFINDDDIHHCLPLADACNLQPKIRPRDVVAHSAALAVFSAALAAY